MKDRMLTSPVFAQLGRQAKKTKGREQRRWFFIEHQKSNTCAKIASHSSKNMIASFMSASRKRPLRSAEWSSRLPPADAECNEWKSTIKTRLPEGEIPILKPQKANLSSVLYLSMHCNKANDTSERTIRYIPRWCATAFTVIVLPVPDAPHKRITSPAP